MASGLKVVLPVVLYYAIVLYAEIVRYHRTMTGATLFIIMKRISAPTAAREWTEVFQMELMNEITIEALNKVAKDFAEFGRCMVNLIVLFMEQV